jgi:hypothetical protein
LVLNLILTKTFVKITQATTFIGYANANKTPNKRMLFAAQKTRGWDGYAIASPPQMRALYLSVDQNIGEGFGRRKR